MLSQYCRKLSKLPSLSLAWQVCNYMWVCLYSQPCVCFWCCSVFTSGINLHQPPSPLSHLPLKFGVQRPALTFTWRRNSKLSLNGQNTLHFHLHYLTLHLKRQKRRRWKNRDYINLHELLSLNNNHSVLFIINKPGLLIITGYLTND